MATGTIEDDGGPPPLTASFESAETATTPEHGRGVRLAFTKDILISGLHTDYTVLVGGERRETVTAFWQDNTVVLMLADPVTWGETVTVAYAKPSSGAMLRDVDGLDVESFGPEAVANNVPRPLTASFESAATAATPEHGRGVKLAFTQDILISGLHTDYTVLVGGERRETVTAFWQDNTVVLMLADPVKWGETVTVAYAKPSSGAMLRDVNGLDIESFGPEAVANNVPQPLTASFESAATAATPEHGRGVKLAFTQDILISGLHTDYTVLVDGERRETVTAFWQDNTVVLMLADPVKWGETVTVAYAKPSSGAMLRDVDGLAIESFGPEAVANTVPEPVNAPATGAPTIAGTAQAGETLTVSTTGIADADGLTNAVFAYQWVSNDGAADADVAGATGSSYTLDDIDVGRRIKVRVSFTDDLGNAESITSAPTVAVLPRPLTAEFIGMPAEHDGKKLFTFELRFSENFPGRLNYKALRDEAFRVTNGQARAAKRMAPGQNQRWEISVRPSSFQDVTVTLPAGSVSTEAGRALSNTVTATVQGPALLSVADARTREGEDAAVAFAVSLSRAASDVVTVDYATLDGTATAGEDYTAARGTLTFAVGETDKTVTVTVLDDAVDEGAETFTLKLRNAQGAWIVDDEATGTIENDDPMPKAWTARFGRSVAVHVVDAVEMRLDGASESYVQVGGRRLGGPERGEEALTQRLAPEPSLWEEAEAGDRAAEVAGQTMTFRDLLLGSAFHLVSNAEDHASGPRLSAWGRVATSGFDGREDKLSLSGTVTTATLGVDGAWNRWLSGLLLAYSEGDGSFTHLDLPGGDVSSSLTSLHPYVSYTLSDRVRLWGVVGYGSGSLRLELEDERAMVTDLTMTMGAVGARGAMLQPTGASGLELALRSDMLWMVMDSASAVNLAATEAEASRLRLVLEGSRPVALAGGGLFTPSLEVGLRHDGGDAETGTGVEVGGRLRYASAWGLSIEASVRGLLAHEAQDFTEWGASGSLRFDPGRQGRGFTASITPAWGSAASGMSRLWDQQGATGLVPADALAAASAGRLDAELGYGLATFQGRGLLTPYARVALSEGADRAWHLGTRLALAEALNLSLEASRRAPAGAAAAHELALRASLGF